MVLYIFVMLIVHSLVNVVALGIFFFGHNHGVVDIVAIRNRKKLFFHFQGLANIILLK